MAIRINHKDNSLQFNEVAAPAQPPSGTAVLYVDITSGALTLKDDANNVSTLGEAAPAGSPTEVQYNDGGVFAGSTDFTWNDTTKILLLGATAQATIRSGTSQHLTIQTGTGNGQLSLLCNSTATGTGGPVSIQAGASSDGAGGSVTIYGGSSAGTNRSASTVELRPGQPTGIGADGYVIIKAQGGSGGASSIRFEDDGGPNYVGLIAPAAVTTPVTWTLPQTALATASGKFLQTDGSGVMSFSNTLGADLDVGGLQIRAAGSTTTYLALADGATVMKTAGTYSVETAGNIAIKPDNKAGTASTTSISAGRSTDGVGGHLTLNGGIGDTGVGGNINLTPGTGSTTNGIVDVTGDLEASGNVISHITIDVKTATPYNLVLADDGRMISMNLTGTANVVQIPSSATAFPIGTQILIEQRGTGVTTIQITTDTLESAGGLVSLASQFSTATIIKTSATRWLLMGDLA